MRMNQTSLSVLAACFCALLLSVSLQAQNVSAIADAPSVTALHLLPSRSVAGAPSVIAAAFDTSAQSALAEQPAPPPPGSSRGWEAPVVDRPFAFSTLALFASSIADVELTTRCMSNGYCTAVPDTLRSRARLYAVGLPLDLGVTYVGYYLKKHNKKFWFMPGGAVTAGNVVYSVHAVQHQ